MANIFESAFMTLKNGMTMYFADSKARQWLQKLQEALAKKYGPDNPPPSTAGKIWYATCSTASGTGAKVATSSTGDFVLATGSMVRVKFTTSNTAANPTISIDGSTAKTIQPKSGTSGMANLIAAGEVVDLVYDGTNFIMTKGSSATTTFYGITKLNSSTSSTSTTEAATPSAVKDVADAKVDRAGDTMTGNLYVAKAGNAYVQAENSVTGTKLNLDSGSSTNHGIYTYGYYDGSSFHSDPKWMIYRGPDGIIRVNGRAADNVMKSGDTMTGNLLVQKEGGAYVRAESSTTGEVLALAANVSANHGIYSYGYYDGSSYQNSAKWMISRGTDGYVTVDRTVFIPNVNIDAYAGETILDKIQRAISNGVIPKEKSFIGVFRSGSLYYVDGELYTSSGKLYGAVHIDSFDFGSRIYTVQADVWTWRDQMRIYEETITVSFAAGTIGTRGFQKKLDYTVPSGFKMISGLVCYLTNSGEIIPIVFNDNSNIYFNAYRATASAVSGNVVKVRVVVSNNEGTL